MGKSELDPSLRYVDISAHRTMTYPRSELASTAHALGIDDIDLSSVTGPQRRFTRVYAHRLYELQSGGGEPRLADIHYPSRLNVS